MNIKDLEIVKALKFFTIRHYDGKTTETVRHVSLHWTWSITWRFILSWAPHNPRLVRFYFVKTYKENKGLNFNSHLNLPFVGKISIDTQPNMKRK